MTHTSGIRDYTDVPGWFQTIRMDRSPEDLIEPTKTFPLQFRPGDAFRYCNAGYYLLGMILEKVSGRTYADFLQERIFKPLGMSATRVDDKKVIVPHRASGYHWEGGALQNGPYISPTQKWAAGAVISTVADMQRAGPHFLSPLGPLNSFVLLEVRDEKASRIYRYRAIFKDSSLLWTFTLTKEGKISSLQPTEE